MAPEMTFAVVCLVSLFAAALTLFSGFGLGTMLLPAFAVVFPPEVAVGATALVHLANNVFKLGLVGRHADRGVALRFGVPAAAAAFLGARLLILLSDLPALGSYALGGRVFTVTPVKLAMGLLIAASSWAELSPSLKNAKIPPRWLPLGGLISGFLGGLSGHQGAPRAAFLTRLGLSPQAFVGTGVVCAIVVDFARLGVYGFSFSKGHFEALTHPDQRHLLYAAVGCAFLGSFFGAKLLGKATAGGVQRLVAAMLLVFGAAIAAGLI